MLFLLTFTFSVWQSNGCGADSSPLHSASAVHTLAPKHRCRRPSGRRLPARRRPRPPPSSPGYLDLGPVDRQGVPPARSGPFGRSTTCMPTRSLMPQLAWIWGTKQELSDQDRNPRTLLKKHESWATCPHHSLPFVCKFFILTISLHLRRVEITSKPVGNPKPDHGFAIRKLLLSRRSLVEQSA